MTNFIRNSISLLHTPGNVLFTCRLNVESDDDNDNLLILQRNVSHFTVMTICVKLYSILNKLLYNNKFISTSDFC